MSQASKSPEEIEKFLIDNAKEKGYFFNWDRERVDALLAGLFTNFNRYGYSSCPCRLSSGKYAKDEDILCPCVYMESDVEKYGSCFCGLYVSKDIFEHKKPYPIVPESRPASRIFAILSKNDNIAGEVIWKCSICGYEYKGANPLDKCPKCGADKKFFKKI